MHAIAHARMRVWLLAILAMLFVSLQAGAAERVAVGEVTFVQGTATAQAPGEPLRFLGKGESIFEGEVLSTGATGFTLIALRDGTKFTLRPNTTFTVEKYAHGGADDNAAFRLLKGGVRALTGLISKRNPQAMQVNTVTATIGIRGTSFDARLCGNECTEEDKRGGARKPRAVRPELIVARVAQLNGTAEIVGVDAQTRIVSVGAAMFTGESLRTGKASHAVLAFRDQSKVTVVADSEFKLEDVRFTSAQADSGNFAVRIVRGGVRALTGFLAKREPKNVNFGVATATIGVRGTGLDAILGLFGEPAAESAFVHAWQDAVDLRVGDRTLAIEQGQTGVFTPAVARLELLPATPPIILQEPSPRPDTVEVNFEQLFATAPPRELGPGFYVGMRNGDVEFRGPGGSIFLSADEAGALFNGENVPVRIPFPLFLLNDPTPTPEAFDERSFRLLELLNPGDLICEIR
jgi:hypothetical protein